MKIVFFGTSDISLPILNGLIANHQVLTVVTSPDKPVGRKQILTPSPIAELATQHNIPILKPERVKNNPELLSELVKLVSKQGVDIFIVVSYGKILPQELLAIPPLQTINIHFSLLPKYRGAAPVQFALLNGETTTGTSIFILDAEVDHGPLLATQAIDIEANDTNISLQEKLAQVSNQLLLETLPKYQAGEITPQEQDHKQATLTKLISKQDGLIDWTKPAQKIYNQFRAYQPWPWIYTVWQDKTIKILDCRLAPTTTSQTIQCGHDTFLELLTIQLEGKKPVLFKDFKNGHPDFDITKF